ncbi:hypothetical protein FACS189472_09620 [Alphaproteobacteria bacterium]|nr:hypothetical protein FACS189472_09620 [Alphaproteobacteria bacterium]
MPREETGVRVLSVVRVRVLLLAERVLSVVGVSSGVGAFEYEVDDMDEAYDAVEAEEGVVAVDYGPLQPSLPTPPMLALA